MNIIVNFEIMKKKIILVIFTILIVVTLIGVGLLKIGLPYLRHKNSLQNFYNYIMCTRCINANFSNEEIEERLLNEMKAQHLNIDEVENMISESKAEKVAILDNPDMLQENLLLKMKNIGSKSTKVEKEKRINKQQNMIFFIKEKSLPYHDKVLSVIQKLKQEQK